MDGNTVPPVNRAIVRRRDEVVATLHGFVPLGRVIHDEAARRLYGSDASGQAPALPLAVVLPANLREISQVLRYCYETGLKVVPRGAGTSLTGGAVGTEDCIIVCLSRMTNVLEINGADRLVRVEAGITTEDVSEAAATVGLHYAPDPDSRRASTIGGNIATNAAGAHALRYGATGQHVLAVKIVLSDGEVIELGGGELEASGYDLVGLALGSEGLLGIVAEATLRILPPPEARRVLVLGFQSVFAALSGAAGIVATGLQLAAVEMMDREVISVCADIAGIDLPRDADAVLIVEIDGNADDLPNDAGMIMQAAEMYGPTTAVEMTDDRAINETWQACSSAMAALGRLGRVRCVDVAVPPSRLAEAMSEIGDIASRSGLRVANMCRATEGIVRSVFLCGEEQDQRLVHAAIDEVARMTVELGGVISGEHGIGSVKREALIHQHSGGDLALHMRLKTVFDTEWLLGNGKVYPLDGQISQTDD